MTRMRNRMEARSWTRIWKDDFPDPEEDKVSDVTFRRDVSSITNTDSLQDQQSARHDGGRQCIGILVSPLP